MLCVCSVAPTHLFSGSYVLLCFTRTRGQFLNSVANLTGAEEPVTNLLSAYRNNSIKDMGKLFDPLFLFHSLTIDV